MKHSTASSSISRVACPPRKHKLKQLHKINSGLTRRSEGASVKPVQSLQIQPYHLQMQQQQSMSLEIRTVTRSLWRPQEQQKMKPS